MPLPLQLNDFQAVLFDMDGLLLDTEKLALHALEQTAVALNYPWSETHSFGMIGKNSRESDRWLAGLWGDKHPTAPFRAAFNVRYQSVIENANIDLKPGVLPLLIWLAESGIPRAVVTSTRSDRAWLKLQRTGLSRYFETLVGGEMVSAGKPSPIPYLQGAAELAIPISECIVLEDSAAGVASGVAAGAQVIHIPDLGHAPIGELHGKYHTAISLFTAHDAMLSAKKVMP